MHTTSSFTPQIRAIAAVGVAIAWALAPLPVRAADAKAVLDEAAAVIAAKRAFTLTADVQYRGKFQDGEEQLDTNFVIAVGRPGDLAVHVENPDSEIHVYLNGDEMTRYIPAFNQYVVGEPDHSPEELVVAAGFELIEPAMRAIGSLISAAPFSGPFAPADLSYVGREDQNGRACDRVRFTAAGYSYDVWVEEAPARLVRRIEPEMTPLEEKFAKEYGIPFDFTVAAVIEPWNLESDGGALLRFTAPEGAEKVASFMPPRPVMEAEKMAGAPAPDFTLPLLGGGEVTLSKERGGVVILDFWATWCGPCRLAMPALHDVAMEYKDKGVKLISIDQGEDAAQVEAFLKQMGLQGLSVALDTQMEVAALYKVEGIPQTVIVGADGVIRIVHVGLWAYPDEEPTGTQEEQTTAIQKVLADALRDELDALLAGKSPD